MPGNYIRGASLPVLPPLDKRTLACTCTHASVSWRSIYRRCLSLTIDSDWCRASSPSTNRRCLLLTTGRGCVPLLHPLSSPHKCCTNTRASRHSTYRCHLEHAENQRQKFVASHRDCAAGDLQLHERTIRMRVHGVRTDSLRALMRRPTQEWCAAADGTTVQSTENGLDMEELGTYGPNFAPISSVSTCAPHVLGQVKVVGENHQPKVHIDSAIAASWNRCIGDTWSWSLVQRAPALPPINNRPRMVLLPRWQVIHEGRTASAVFIADT